MLRRTQLVHPLRVGQHVRLIEEPVTPALAPPDLALPRKLPQRHRAVAREISNLFVVIQVVGSNPSTIKNPYVQALAQEASLYSLLPLLPLLPVLGIRRLNWAIFSGSAKFHTKTLQPCGGALTKR